MFDSTTGFGSLRPAAPICCRRCAGRGHPFCFSVQQLYCMLILCSAMLHFFSSAQWVGTSPSSCMRTLRQASKVSAKPPKPWNANIWNDKAKWADWILTRLTNPTLWTAAGTYHTAHFVLLNVSFSMCGCYMFWNLETSFRSFDMTEDQLIPSLYSQRLSECHPVFFPWSFSKPSAAVVEESLKLFH